MVRRWLERWRVWRKENEARQKHNSHRNHQVLTRGKISIVVQCTDCGLDEPLWNRHWCNVVRLTQIPHDLTGDSIAENC